MLGDRAVGPSLAGIKDEIDLSILMDAVRTVFSKGTTRLTQQEAMATMQAFASAKQGAAGAKNREEGNAFLAKNKTEKGVITTRPACNTWCCARAAASARCGQTRSV